MKASFVTWSVIVALTLVIWLFFYYASEPLEAPGTAVAAAFSIALVYGGKWLYQVLMKGKPPT
jgi:hypothetical protein